MSDDGLRARAAAQLAALSRWHPAEFAFWVAAVAALFLFPERSLLLSEIFITALFALSLDLILGYAGIVSLGHAAFFGLGAYVAGVAALHGVAEPVLGLVLAWAAATALGFATSFLVLRGSDLTRLMVTLGVALVLYEVGEPDGVAHRRRGRPARHGGRAGPRPVRVRPGGRGRRRLQPCRRCSWPSCWRGAWSTRPSAGRCAREGQRAPHARPSASR